MQLNIDNALNGISACESEAMAILTADQEQLSGLLAVTDKVRRHHFGNAVHLCSIVNARSGACSEDCAFCAQSALHATDTEIFSLRSGDTIVGARDDAADLPIGHFGIVTSGNALSRDEMDAVCKTITSECGTRSPQVGAPQWCASLGGLSQSDLARLKESGLKRFHHNLETAESYFPKVCTTHTYAERLATLRDAREAGLEVCSGGLFGIGESLEQRVELANTLAAEEVDSIPLNFLIPIEGTKMGKLTPMEPREILKCIAMFRMVNPKAEIKVCAGRLHLRSLQPLIFAAGATGMMIGPLLTVAGGDVETDLQMVRDLGLVPQTEC